MISKNFFNFFLNYCKYTKIIRKKQVKIWNNEKFFYGNKFKYSLQILVNNYYF